MALLREPAHTALHEFDQLSNTATVKLKLYELQLNTPYEKQERITS